MADHWHRICASATLTEGKPRHFQFEAHDVLVVRVAGTVYAVDNMCSHADACLHEGRVRGHRIICPLHGASFDARSGAVLAPPATAPLRRYEARDADGEICIRLPAPVGGSER